MNPTIRQIFFNLKTALIITSVLIATLIVQIIHLTDYTDRLSALRNQHLLIDKIITTNLDDPQMATITINGAIAELTLLVKNSQKEPFLDTLFDNEKSVSLNNALINSSNNFQESALFWSESMIKSRPAMYQRMIDARNLYLLDTHTIIDHQIERINDSVGLLKINAYVVLILSLVTFLLYRWRLNQILRDIKGACSVDVDGTPPSITTEEIGFLVRKLSRKTPNVNTNPTLLNPISGINNEKGMFTAYSAKRNNKNVGSLFLVHFEIDKHDALMASLSKDDMNGMYKKIAEILSMYEQPLDIIGHLENNTFAFLMARSSKDVALSDAEKIVASVAESMFVSEKGNLKITLSAGLALKLPAKTLEESLPSVAKITEKAKESGGNRVAQLRDGLDPFR